MFFFDGTDKSFFLEWSYNVNKNNKERITHLSNKLFTYKYTDCLSSSDLKNALRNMYNDFVVA